MEDEHLSSSSDPGSDDGDLIGGEVMDDGQPEEAVQGYFGCSDGVLCLAINPKDPILTAIGSCDERLHIVRMESSEPVLITGEPDDDDKEQAEKKKKLDEETMRQSESISTCAWSADGRFLAVGDLAGVVWVYKEDSSCIFKGELPEDWLGVSCIAFHQDKPCFVVGTEGGRMAVIYIQTSADGVPQIIVASYPSPHVGSSYSYDSEGGSNSEIVWLKFVGKNIISVSVDGLVQCQPAITDETKNKAPRGGAGTPNPLGSAHDHYTYGAVTGLTSVNLNDTISSSGPSAGKQQKKGKGVRTERRGESVQVVTCTMHINSSPTAPDILACGCDNGMTYLINMPTCKVASCVDLRPSAVAQDKRVMVTTMPMEDKKIAPKDERYVVSTSDFIVTSAGMPLLCVGISLMNSGTGYFVVRDINHSANRIVIDLPSAPQCSSVVGVYNPLQFGLVNDSVALGCENGNLLIINALNGTVRLITSEPTTIYSLAVHSGDPTYIIAGHDSGSVWVYNHGVAGAIKE